MAERHKLIRLPGSAVDFTLCHPDPLWHVLTQYRAKYTTRFNSDLGRRILWLFRKYVEANRAGQGQNPITLIFCLYLLPSWINKLSLRKTTCWKGEVTFIIFLIFIPSNSDIVYLAKLQKAFPEGRMSNRKCKSCRCGLVICWFVGKSHFSWIKKQTEMQKHEREELEKGFLPVCY